MAADDATNKFGVGFAGHCVEILTPPQGPFKARDAYLLAAYLVRIAEKIADPKEDGTFETWRNAVPPVSAEHDGHQRFSAE